MARLSRILDEEEHAMSKNPADQNQQRETQSPVQLRFYTDEHGWVEIDPNVPLSQQPIASSWFQTPPQNSEFDQNGYHTMVIESASFPNNGQPQQRGMMFSSGVPPMNTFAPPIPETTPIYQSGQPFPNIPTPPGFEGFPPQMVNPWAPGGFNGSSPSPPFPLFQFTQVSTQPGTQQVPFTIPVFPGPQQMPFPSQPFPSPWFPPNGTQYTNTSSQPSPNKPANPTNNSALRVDANNHSSHPIMPWVGNEWMTGYQPRSVCHHCSCPFFVPTYLPRQVPQPWNKLCSGDNFCRAVSEISEHSDHALYSCNNDTEHHLGKVRSPPQPLSHPRHVNICIPPNLYGSRHANEHLFDQREPLTGVWNTPHQYGTNSLPQTVYHGGFYHTPNETFSFESSRPESAASLATAYLQPGLDSSINFEGVRQPLPADLSTNRSLPPPPCQCCRCSQFHNGQFVNGFHPLVSVPLSSCKTVQRPLKHSASHELVANGLTFFGSTDMNAGHSLEALEPPIGAQHTSTVAMDSLLPPVYTEKSSSNDSIITAFVKAASKKLEANLAQMRVNKEQ